MEGKMKDALSVCSSPNIESTAHQTVLEGPGGEEAGHISDALVQETISWYV